MRITQQAGSVTVKVMRAEVGVDCFCIPDERVLILNPALNPRGARSAIHAVLPAAHNDLVAHWVHEALPPQAPIILQRGPYFQPAISDLDTERHSALPRQANRGILEFIGAIAGTFALCCASLAYVL
ncbi:hypothetical protein FHR83_007119 [Actinoplanes campanulatus]|uniref:Uncharacterized protein n=1 Tax=Actinoplanes campanulatus TaxID=113559 RepID=A0A7W5FI70_9ACTN|nr:hypothetical protein [Actinoplanes campanulatus]MBB3099413.1 hypothetical protein [Actinoplanes campanulatus]GGN40100.1 hypothetical protein GCM10010109_68730 [Actinoplanes campanulatus]GID42378.1 hypothetical protein Aca09nite_88840 [Actinoplanes campanulatus]